MSNKSGCAALLIFLLLCVSVALNLVLLGLLGAGAMKNRIPQQASQLEEVLLVDQGTPEAKIAVVPVRGGIFTDTASEWGESMVDDIQRALRQAKDDPQVKAVVLVVDSPGGEVTAADMLYHEVLAVREQKPVVVYMESLAASAAYYISCGANWLVASETTFTGSIGVIIQTLNYQGLFDKIGLAAVVFKSGAFKDMLSGARPMTPEEKQYVEGLVQQVYGRFLEVVAKARNLPAAELRGGVADGRILTGRDALEARLIDQLGFLDDAYAKARELAGIPAADVVRYEPSFTFGRLMRLLQSHASQHLEVRLPGTPEFQLQPGRAYWLPEFFAW